MKIKKILLALGVLAVASMAFVACSSGEESTQDPTTTEVSETTEPTDSTEVEVAEVAEVESTEATNGTEDVYRIEYDQADEQGWKTFLEVTVKDGVTTNVNFDEVNTSDDEADDALEQALLTATTPEEFEQMIEGQAEAETFKSFVAELMPQIEQGNKETIIVNK